MGVDALSVCLPVSLWLLGALSLHQMTTSLLRTTQSFRTAAREVHRVRKDASLLRIDPLVHSSG